MAEARNAIELYYLQKQGFQITGVEDGYYTLTVSLPYPKTILQASIANFQKMMKYLKNRIWPASMTTVLGVMSGVSVAAINSSSDSWIRSGGLANILWKMDSTVNRFNPVHKHLAVEVRVAYLAATTAFFGMLGIVAFERLILRLLLRSKSWLYMAPRQKTPLKITIWGALLTIFSGHTDLTYSFALSLPALPLPSLKHTISHYLESVRPVMSDDEFEETKVLAEKFKQNEGKKFQRYLWFKWLTSTNYLSEWWEKYVYLRGRTPLCVNSNYYIMDSKFRPTTNQTERAANVAHYFLLFKDEIENETLKPLMIRGKIPLCMEQYKRMFGTCRIPGKEFDELKHTYFTRHIVFLYKGEYFQVDVYHGARGTKLVPYSRAEIKEKLDEIIAFVDRMNLVSGDVEAPPPKKVHSASKLTGTKIQSYSDLAILRAGYKNESKDASDKVISYDGSGIGALTASPRSNWAEIREIYFSRGVNRVSLRAIEKAAFFLVLDKKEQPTMNSRAKSLFHGDGFSRYFDKSLTLIVFKDGYFGLNTEHSWADAPAVAHLFEYALLHELQDYQDRIATAQLTTKTEESVLDLTSLANPAPLPASPKDKTISSKHLLWEIDDQLERAIQQAGMFAQTIIDDVDLEVMEFTDFGAGFMKKSGLSPDAFIQMALQLTYFRLFNKFDLTYEASMTRLFRKGRTETVRSLSIQAAKWVRAMEANKGLFFHDVSTNALDSIPENSATQVSSDLSKEDLVELLKDACEHHVKLSKDAMVGRGIDRHLFALYITSRGFDVDSEFLNQALSTPWRLSTSQQSQNQTDLRDALHPEIAQKFLSPGGGFGPVADDGFGVSYMIVGNEHVFFHVSSKFSSPQTSSKKFIEGLRKSLNDMKILLS